jgi:hypothetical protein
MLAQNVNGIQPTNAPTIDAGLVGLPIQEKACQENSAVRKMTKNP